MSKLKQRTLKPTGGKHINKILHIHADWLENDGQHVKARECRIQADNCRQNQDPRQIEGFTKRRRNDRANV